MASSTLEWVKTLVDQLNDHDRHALARYLNGLATSDAGRMAATVPLSPTVQPNIAWLKQHRETYAGKYVALVDGKLVGCGGSQREAREQALQQGASTPLIMRVTSLDETLPGGF